MKKILLNVSDFDYEKFRLEAIHEKKSIPNLINERIFFKPFHKEVLDSFDNYIESSLEKILKE